MLRLSFTITGDIMADPISREDIDNLFDYAVTLHHNGWTQEAFNVCNILAGNGITSDREDVRSILTGFSRLDPTRDDMGPHKQLTLMRTNQGFSSLHLTHHLTDHQKRVAFKSGVGFINIETSYQCNRNCPYCPNFKYDRRKSNSFLDWDAYNRMMEDLASIDYDRRISLVGLNEPLMHMEDFLARLRVIREKIPKSYILIFTNGDFLDKAALKAMEDLKVNELKVAIHNAPTKPYDERDILKRTMDKACELGLQPLLTHFKRDKVIEFRMLGSPITVRYSQENYMTEGHSRGDAMPDVGRKITNRTAPCLQPFDNFIVTYLGHVLPCCTVFGDNEMTERVYLGNIKEHSIFDLYAGEKLAAWRRTAMVEGEKQPPCSTCPEMWPGFPANWQEIYDKALAVAQTVEPQRQAPAP